MVCVNVNTSEVVYLREFNEPGCEGAAFQRGFVIVQGAPSLWSLQINFPGWMLLMPLVSWEFKLQSCTRAVYSSEFSGVTFIQPTSTKAVVNVLNTPFTQPIIFSFSDTEIVDLQRSLRGAIILIPCLAQPVGLHSFSHCNH